MSREAEAVAAICEDELFAVTVGPGLTCYEANTLAGWLTSIGENKAAETLLAGHAAGDDEGDEHYLAQYDGMPSSQRPAWLRLIKD